jgi:hypothetical protein
MQSKLSKFIYQCHNIVSHLCASFIGFLTPLRKHKMTISSTFFHHFMRYYSYQVELYLSIEVGWAEM